ncbi:MAG: SGNH/GDSL hydrolase family protein, partial [Phycisphaerales bacterium]
MVASSRIRFACVLALLLSVLVVANDGSYVLRGNERTLEAVLKAYSEIPPVRYAPPVERWEKMPKTKSLLIEGGVLHVVMLGDSIVNDTSRSGWDYVVGRRHPRCTIEKVTSVRGSTGCSLYKEAGRVQKFVLDHQPDLVIIGGISQGDDIDSIREVIRQIRESAQPDVLLMTGAFGAIDPRVADFLDENGVHGTPYNRNLAKLAGEVGAAFLDME